MSTVVQQQTARTKHLIPILRESHKKVAVVENLLNFLCTHTAADENKVPNRHNEPRRSIVHLVNTLLAVAFQLQEACDISPMLSHVQLDRPQSKAAET